MQASVTYKEVWDDGFCARGWKVNATFGDPEIVTSARETGHRINTSVFTISWIIFFPALVLAVIEARRWPSCSIKNAPVPTRDLILRSYISNGSVNGENLYDFLPADLYAFVPKDSAMKDKATMSFLRKRLGEGRLQKSLVDHFLKLSKVGETHADKIIGQLLVNYYCRSQKRRI